MIKNMAKKDIHYIIYVVVDDDDEIYSKESEKNKIISFIQLVKMYPYNF